MAPFSLLESEHAFVDVMQIEKQSIAEGSLSSLDRSVGFADCDEIISDRSCSSQDTWLSKKDIQDIKLEAARSVQLIMAGKHRNNPAVCERGLEDMSKAGAVQIRSRRAHARRVVLEEQENQREQQSFNPDRLVCEYQRASGRSILPAIARARIDEQVARS